MSRMLSVLLIALFLSACAAPAALPPQMAVIPEATHTPVPTIALSLNIETLTHMPPQAEVADTQVKASGAAAPDALAETLGNLSYSGLFPEKGITLKDGFYEYSEGGVGTPHIRFVDRQIVLGDLNEDGAQDAVVMLEDDSEGTARLTFLVAVLGDSNASTPPSEARKSATHGSAEGGRAGREGAGLDGRSLAGRVPPSAPTQLIKGIWP